MSFVADNILVLQEGLELLDSLSPKQYTEDSRPTFHSSIGAHFRHLIEHYTCFMQQWPSEQVCYQERARDNRIETDLEYARAQIQRIIDELPLLNEFAESSALLVKDADSSEFSQSTLARELVFLQSHSLHHYALIGAISRYLGGQPKSNFGVAISTLEHQQECSEASSKAE